MHQLTALLIIETKLALRDPLNWLVVLVLPAGALLGIGQIFAPHVPDPLLGGARFIDLLVPSLAVISLAIVGVNLMPLGLGAYRDKGILRRLSTTPVRPATLLLAQVIIYSGLAVVSVVLLMVAGNLAFDIPYPAHVPGFIVSLALGLAALFGIGLLVAALAPTGGAATAIALPIFFVVMFIGGVYLPRWLLPEIIVTLGTYVPPGVQALQDSWTGAGPELLPLAIMALIATATSAGAVRLFRWE
jgi:ABC-2 type transport system permease protein